MDEVTRELQVALLEAYNTAIDDAARFVRQADPALAAMLEKALVKRFRNGRPV